VKIRELMTKNVETAPPETTLAAAADTLYRKDCGAIVVTSRAGELLGIATDRDMFIALGTRDRLPSELTLGSVMSKSPLTCGADEDVKAGLERMRRAKVRRLPVIDGKGAVLGLLSLDDLARCAAPAGAKGGLSEDDVVATLKSICEPRPAAAKR
jgi:CBS domain-containing protein